MDEARTDTPKLAEGKIFSVSSLKALAFPTMISVYPSLESIPSPRALAALMLPPSPVNPKVVELTCISKSFNCYILIIII